MGFLVARYFGLREFGRIYGWLYGAFIFASGLGPLWVGALRDATGNYTLALEISTGGLILACVGFLMLPRYETAHGAMSVTVDEDRWPAIANDSPKPSEPECAISTKNASAIVASPIAFITNAFFAAATAAGRCWS